jgi:hypothetical protein
MATKSNDASNGEVQSRQLTAQFHAYMVSRARQNGENRAEMTEDIMEQQAARIMSATTVDEIMSADMGGTVQCRDVPNTFWEIRGMEPYIGNRTDLDNDYGYYVQYDATCLGGDPEVMARNGLEVGTVYPLQTSAILLMLKVRALEAAEALPMRLALVGKKTQSNRTVLKWGPMPVTVQSGQAG